MLTKVYVAAGSSEAAEAMQAMSDVVRGADNLRRQAMAAASRPTAPAAKKKKRDTISLGGFTSSTNIRASRGRWAELLFPTGQRHLP
eukprot:4637792-Pleurochrysis_carterae.AAC.1